MANDKILADLKTAIETWNINLIQAATKQAVDAKISVKEIVEFGLGKGMETIGTRFDAAEIHLPQVVAASKTRLPEWRHVSWKRPHAPQRE